MSMENNTIYQPNNNGDKEREFNLEEGIDLNDKEWEERIPGNALPGESMEEYENRKRLESQN